MDKIEFIERSLRCFWFSLLGLIPVFGLPLAIHAIFRAHVLRGVAAGGWNPARQYQVWSSLLGWLGILLTVVALVSITIFIENRLAQQP